MKNKFHIGAFFDSIIDKMTMYMLAFMVLMVFINACLRYLFAKGIMVNEELARFSFVWLCLLGSLVAYKRKSHIRITILSDSIKSKKIKNTLYSVSRIITTGAIIFLSYGAVLYFLKATEYINAGIPVNFGIIVCVVPIMAFGMLVTDITECYRYISGKKKSSDGVAAAEEKASHI